MRLSALSLAVPLALLVAACGAQGRPAPAASPAKVPVAHPVTTSISPTASPASQQASTAPPSQTTARAPKGSGQSSPGPPGASGRTSKHRLHAKTSKPKAWRPSAPQPTISQAAYALVQAWSTGDRALALQDASPSAVTALFSHRYPAGGPQFRGCSTPPGDAPASCVYRSGNDLLSLTVTLTKGGYVVTAAAMES